MKKIIKLLLRKFGFKITRYETLPFSRKLLETYDYISPLVSSIKKRHVQGIFVESGFGYGRSFAILSYLAEKHSTDLVGIDSFVGFPSISVEDASKRNPVIGEWNVRSLEEATRYINGLGFFQDKTKAQVRLIPLIFGPNAINPIPNEKVSFLHIDLDLYHGYKYALDMFYDQVQPGGIILFDEYGEELWPGATKAVDEFLFKIGRHKKDLKKIKGKYHLIKK